METSATIPWKTLRFFVRVVMAFIIEKQKSVNEL